MAVMTRRQCLVVAALGAGLLAAACDMAERTGGDVAPDATQESRPAIAKPPGSDLPRQTQRQIPVLVRFIPVAFGPLTADQFREYTAPFTEAHPHLTIEWQEWRDTRDLYQALEAAVAAGQAGDIMQDHCESPLVARRPRPVVGRAGGTAGTEPVHPARRLRPHRLLAGLPGAQHLARRPVRAAYPRGYAARVL